MLFHNSAQFGRIFCLLNITAYFIYFFLRFSFGRFNTDADVEKALEIIPAVISKLRALSPVNTARQPAPA